MINLTLSEVKALLQYLPYETRNAIQECTPPLRSAVRALQKEQARLAVAAPRIGCDHDRELEGASLRSIHDAKSR